MSVLDNPAERPAGAPPRGRFVYTKARLRRELARRRSRRAARQLAAAAADPRAFREHLRLGIGKPRLGAAALPWQRESFEALDAAWLRVAGVPVPADSFHAGPPATRAWLERPRGHSKTADIAVQLAWALRFAARPVRGVVAAADRDQAGLVRAALADLVRANPEFLSPLNVGAENVSHPATGARLDVISGDVGSSYGLTPDFVVCDELCHWPREELWHSLLSSAAKSPGCLLVVLTNAGWGRDWRWAAREAARTRDDWRFHRLPGPCAPWITPAVLAEQRALLPAPVFGRLWLNEWGEHPRELTDDWTFGTLPTWTPTARPSLGRTSAGVPTPRRRATRSGGSGRRPRSGPPGRGSRWTTRSA